MSWYRNDYRLDWTQTPSCSRNQILKDALVQTLPRTWDSSYEWLVQDDLIIALGYEYITIFTKTPLQ